MDAGRFLQTLDESGNHGNGQRQDHAGEKLGNLVHWKNLQVYLICVFTLVGIIDKIKA